MIPQLFLWSRPEVPVNNSCSYNSISRLTKLEEDVDFILGAHNEARLDAGRLRALQGALLKLRSGDYEAETDAYGRLAFEIDDFKMLTSRPALDGKQGDISLGGSGLDGWPTE